MPERGFPSPAALRSGEVDLIAHIEAICDRIDAEDPLVQALLPEPARRQRLTDEAEGLLKRFPDPPGRPSLFGLLVGVKDFSAWRDSPRGRVQSCRHRCSTARSRRS